MTGPIAALRNGITNITNYQGRASRPEFWWLWASALVLSFIVGFVIESTSLAGTLGQDGADLLAVLVYVAGIAIMLPAAVRRMHDSNRSGFWVIVPLVNFILLLFPSDPGVNRFGPPTRGP